MSFGDHLDELRICMIRALIGVALTTAFTLIFGKQILQVIFYPLQVVQFANGLAPSLQVLSPTGAFTAYLKIGILSGLILSAPWVLMQSWRFIATGLYTHEQRFMRLLMPASIGLFVAGVLFLYFIVLPIVLQFFISFNRNFDVPNLAPTYLQQLLLPEDTPAGVQTESLDLPTIPVLSEDPPDPKAGQMWVNTSSRRLVIQTANGPWSQSMQSGSGSNSLNSQFSVDFYITFVLMLSLAFGIAFEAPIVVFFLAWSGLVTVEAMKRARRYVVLGIIMLAAVLTPPDVVSQMFLALPMYLLFELGLVVAQMTQRKTK